MPFYGVDREVEQGGDLRQRLVEHVLQDDDAALRNAELQEARYRSLDRFLAHQHLHGIGACRISDV